jgi:SARP family transcriptional regulator, regulator of embCAB operon
VSSNGVGFGVLGPLEMTVGGTPVSLGPRKQRAVLGMLVINRNRAVGTEALIDAAWGQRAPQEARASLHTYVSNLRRLLNSAGVDGRTVLAAAPPGYRLCVADIDCDIGRFSSRRPQVFARRRPASSNWLVGTWWPRWPNGVDRYSRT